MRLSIEATLDYHFPDACDMLLAIEAAPLVDQRLIENLLVVDGVGALHPVAAEEGIGRRTWMRVEGRIQARFTALVDIGRVVPALDALAIAPLRELPSHVVPYLWPSRYCESDRFEGFVERHFGQIEGGARIAAMSEWIRREIEYASVSDGTTTAADTFVAQAGVCRDFAHLLASFSRAAGVPARLVSAYAPDVEPPDFHAVVEVWLGDAWQLVDPTGMAKAEETVRICVGRDATDIAFMTSFGLAEMNSQSVQVTRT